MGISQHFDQEGVGIGYLARLGIKDQYAFPGCFEETAVTGFRGLQRFLQLPAFIDVGDRGLAERIFARARGRRDGVKLGVKGCTFFLQEGERAGLLASRTKYFF